MKNYDDVYDALRWAEQLANKYGLGINTIVDEFVQANKELKDPDAAKAFIENEMKSMRRDIYE